MEIDRLRDGDSPLAPTDAVRAAGVAAAPDDPAAAGAADERSAARADYRAKVDAVYLDAAREHWETAAKPAFRHEWSRYAEAHPVVPGTSVSIDQAAITSVRRGCEDIRETEEKVVTPAMLRIEAEDSGRRLVGLEFRCKSEERIMEKVAGCGRDSAPRPRRPWRSRPGSGPHHRATPQGLEQRPSAPNQGRECDQA